MDFPNRSVASLDFEAASREPSVMARRSGVDESRAATTAKRSLARTDESAAERVYKTLSSDARAVARDWRLAPPSADSAVVISTCSSPDPLGNDQRYEIDGPGHQELLRQSSMPIQ